MLYFETVESNTLSILKQLMSLSALEKFSLVGGTALSLRYGHRTSMDLDLFNHETFENAPILEALENEFGSKLDYKDNHRQFGIFCFIDGVKVDIIRYPHLPIAEIVTEEGIRIYSDKMLSSLPDIVSWISWPESTQIIPRMWFELV